MRKALLGVEYVAIVGVLLLFITLSSTLSALEGGGDSPPPEKRGTILSRKNKDKIPRKIHRRSALPWFSRIS